MRLLNSALSQAPLVADALVAPYSPQFLVNALNAVFDGQEAKQYTWMTATDLTAGLGCAIVFLKS